MQIYLVGGAVRDKLLGIAQYDRDYVVTGAKPQDLISQGYKQVGKDFPVFLHPTTHEEYALARTERKSGSGYTGFICDFSPEVTLEEDLRRRDLTINAIAEAEDGTLIDPYHGLLDLKHKILRHVSPAFSEDPLRVLRAARFAAKLAPLGFTLAPETLQLMEQMAKSGELSALTPERVWIELEKALKTDAPQVFFEILQRCGALKVILPELDALYGVPGPAKWHPEIDTFVHVMMTMKVITKLTSDLPTRFAMLCHDLGKALTPPQGWPHHSNHEELGLKPLKSLCTRLRVPREFADLALIIVRWHGEFHHLDKNGAEGIVKLFETIDAYRRPQRMLPWLLCCKADFLGRLGFENLTFERPDHVMRLYQESAKVSAAQFVAAGLKGPEVSHAVHDERVRVIAALMESLPPNALGDNTPPLTIERSAPE